MYNTGSVRSHSINPNLHYFDLLRTRCAACSKARSTTNPQQIEVGGVWALTLGRTLPQVPSVGEWNAVVL